MQVAQGLWWLDPTGLTAWFKSMTWLLKKHLEHVCPKSQKENEEKKLQCSHPFLGVISYFLSLASCVSLVNVHTLQKKKMLGE